MCGIYDLSGFEIFPWNLYRIEEERSIFWLFDKKKTNFGFEGHNHNDNGERGAYYGGGNATCISTIKKLHYT